MQPFEPVRRRADHRQNEFPDVDLCWSNRSFDIWALSVRTHKSGLISKLGVRESKKADLKIRPLSILPKYRAQHFWASETQRSTSPELWSAGLQQQQYRKKAGEQIVGYKFADGLQLSD